MGLRSSNRARGPCTPGGDAVPILEPAFFGLTKGGLADVRASIVFGFVLNRTMFARDVLAIGGNVEAARLPASRCCAAASWCPRYTGCPRLPPRAARLAHGLGDPKTSIGLELVVISARVLGSVSLARGMATISGVVIGVLIMSCVRDVMGVLHVANVDQYLRGGILLLAVMFDRWETGRKASMIR